MSNFPQFPGGLDPSKLKPSQESWTWLKDEPMSVADINRNLWRASVSSLTFYILLGLACFIATFGLLANSVAVIIGAMIIAPLMGPILGIAYAIVMGNRKLFRRATVTLFTGIILVIVLAAISTFLISLQEPDSEILGRTSPSSIDLFVALAAGAAGGYANSRRSIADAIPGVAIAVALVPPLSVVGICLAWQEIGLAGGALLLFATNLFGIILSAGLVFLWQSYGSWSKARQRLTFPLIMLCLLGIPLGLEMRNLILEDRIKQNVIELAASQLSTSATVDIRSVEIQSKGNKLLVDLKVATDYGSLSQELIDVTQKFLKEKLGSDVYLKVYILPIQVIEGSKP